MKKRVIFSITAILLVLIPMLLLTIFQLYKDAEKVQRSIFTTEVLNACSNAINKIDQVLKGDSVVIVNELSSSIDTTQAITFQQHAKRFLLDQSRVQPIGVIRSTISYMRNGTIQTVCDTIIYDTTIIKKFVPYPMAWEKDFEKFITEQNLTIKKKGFNIDLIEMDSNTIRLLNRNFLYRIIKESLVEQNINASFDFALFNEFTGQFVIPPEQTSQTRILESDFIFSLKPSEKFITRHYIIVYFPTERLILLKRYGTITALIVVFVAILLLIFVYMIVNLFRQKKIADIKNDFINNITHEFKTPLSTITLACEALIDSKMCANKETRNAYISIISDENERIKVMVDNILQLAKLNRGQVQINLETVDIHELIAKICNSFSLLIKSQNGNIAQYLHAARFEPKVDKIHIQNMIINLIDNAIKYCVKEPNVVIRTENDKKYLLISISDNGIGIPKKSMKYIFNDFYRTPTGNIHNQKGHGLGLAYVKKIVHLHNGEIQVISELGKGSTFCIMLPLK